ncbi:MAG TPA: NAD-dependent epimerase/dehydratase family protein [Gemmatimonadaceae bacterium]
MKVLVTGGTGVVGGGMVTELLRRGHIVVLLSRHAESDARRWPSGVAARPGDVADAASIREAAAGCDAVIHLAGIVDENDGATFEAVNVRGTANMLRETTRAGVRRFVYVSSLGAPTGESAYHRSKRDAEALVRGFAGAWTIARPGNVYGPGDEQISLLLRMVRGPIPVVPRIGDGDQPIQPLWWEDAAQALASIVERDDLSGRELDLAGVEVTSQNDLLARLQRITGCEVHSVQVPEFIASVGAKLVSLVGWDVSLNDDQLQMLREGSAIAPGAENALIGVLGITPTPLDAGLRRLADLQPEQLPADGVGTLKRKRYWADIERCTHSPDALFARFRRHFDDVTPVFVDVGAEPSTNDGIEQGETLTLSLPMRGHVQVRVAELEPRQATLLTVEGHPLAGAVRFICEQRGAAVRFQVEVFDRPSNVIDLIAMRTLGDRLQDATWRQVVERMVAHSGGHAPAGVQHATESLDEEEARLIERWLEEVSVRLQRDENAARIARAR